jgi:hypothetical protein
MPNKRWMENKIKSLELKWIIIIIDIIWKNYKYNYSFLNKINSTSMSQKIFFQFLLNWLFFDLSFEFTSNFSLYYISLIFSTTQKYFFNEVNT